MSRQHERCLFLHSWGRVKWRGNEKETSGGESPHLWLPPARRGDLEGNVPPCVLVTAGGVVEPSKGSLLLPAALLCISTAVPTPPDMSEPQYPAPLRPATVERRPVGVLELLMGKATFLALRRKVGSIRHEIVRDFRDGTQP